MLSLFSEHNFHSFCLFFFILCVSEELSIRSHSSSVFVHFGLFYFLSSVYRFVLILHMPTMTATATIDAITNWTTGHIGHKEHDRKWIENIKIEFNESVRTRKQWKNARLEEATKWLRHQRFEWQFFFGSRAHKCIAFAHEITNTFLYYIRSFAFALDTRNKLPSKSVCLHFPLFLLHNSNEQSWNWNCFLCSRFLTPFNERNKGSENEQKQWTLDSSKTYNRLTQENIDAVIWSDERLKQFGTFFAIAFSVFYPFNVVYVAPVNKYIDISSSHTGRHTNHEHVRSYTGRAIEWNWETREKFYLTRKKALVFSFNFQLHAIFISNNNIEIHLVNSVYFIVWTFR